MSEVTLCTQTDQSLRFRVWGLGLRVHPARLAYSPPSSLRPEPQTLKGIPWSVWVYRGTSIIRNSTLTSSIMRCATDAIGKVIV
jgi:hypothetical protein